MGEIIDKYHLNLYCICINCKNREINGKAYSCPTYPKEKGIPSEIWNSEEAECPFFEPIRQENEEGYSSIAKESASNKGINRNYGMKKFSDLITKKNKT